MAAKGKTRETSLEDMPHDEMVNHIKLTAELKRSITDAAHKVSDNVEAKDGYWIDEIENVFWELVPALIQAARVNAAAEMRERCAGHLEHDQAMHESEEWYNEEYCEGWGCKYPQITASQIRALPLDAQDDAWLRAKIEQAIEAGVIWARILTAQMKMGHVGSLRPTAESILATKEPPHAAEGT